MVWAECLECPATNPKRNKRHAPWRGLGHLLDISGLAKIASQLGGGMTILPQNFKVFLGVIAGCLLAVAIVFYATHNSGDVSDTGVPSSLIGATSSDSIKAQKKPTLKKPQQQQLQSLSNDSATSTTVVLPKEPVPRARYLSAKWDAIHFKPAIDKATNAQCLSCHHEIITHRVRDVSPAGLRSSQAKAWYQTLDTYTGDQVSFHKRHLTSPFAKKVMNLKCNFCHQGNDPREETGRSSATTVMLGDFTMRKTVNPEKSCLMCHGKFPSANMGLEGTWAEMREGFEDEETRNGCLICHQEDFRTVRHKVNFLNAKAIEDLAQKGTSDVCLGCHGGRAWYRTSYPYPRHPWPNMPEETPEWAKDRPKVSAPQHQISTK